MNQPFSLPEGMMWRDFDDRDRTWWCGDGKGSRPMGNGVPLEQCAATFILFRLRHRETGEERIVWDRGIVTKCDHDSDEWIQSTAYYYTEGNCGCGCNRAILWAHARGEDYPEEPECEQHWDITWPEWLARCDAEPCERFADPPPWRAHVT